MNTLVFCRDVYTPCQLVVSEPRRSLVLGVCIILFLHHCTECIPGRELVKTAVSLILDLLTLVRQHASAWLSLVKSTISGETLKMFDYRL